MAGISTYGFRELINDLHLWLGLAAGIVLVVVCLTGTILAFEAEIREATREGMTVRANGEPRPVSELIATVEAAGTDSVTGVTLPATADAPYRFTVIRTVAGGGAVVLADPYTGAHRLEGRSAADGFLTGTLRLHRWLLLRTPVGRPIVGIATVAFLVLIVSGLIIWFPKKLRWRYVKQGFKIRTSAGWKRINHDLHNALGFYAAVMLFLMGLTGLCWSFDGYRAGLGGLLGATIFERGGPDFGLGAGAQEKGLSVDAILSTARSTFPEPGELAVNLPSERNPYYAIRFTPATALSPAATDRLYLSRSGNQLALARFADKHLGERTAELIKALHTGEVFGTVSKTLYFLACLIATSLPVTGTLIWWNKRRKKRRRYSN